MTTRDKSAAGQIFTQMTRGRNVSNNFLIISADVMDNDEGDTVLGEMYMTLTNSKYCNKVFRYVDIEKGGIAVTTDPIDRCREMINPDGINIILGYDSELRTKLMNFVKLAEVLAERSGQEFSILILEEGSRKKNEEVVKKLNRLLNRKHLVFSTMTKKLAM